MPIASELQQQIEDCENREGRLDDWQRGFVDSVKKQLADGRGLSPKQEAKLDEIWESVTKDG